MTKGLFALLLAGTFMIPLTVSALGDDTTVGLGASRNVKAQPPAWEPLPPVPYLDAMPWLLTGKPAGALGVEHLYGPKLQTLGPFLLPPEIPPPRLTWEQVPAGSQLSTE